MKTKNYISFHIGRGGSFNNQGHLSFSGEEDFQDLIRRCSDKCLIVDSTIDENNNEIQLPDNKWHLDDLGSNVILEGRDKIEALTGILDWDGDYNTDYVTTTDNLSQKELDTLYKAYLAEEWMSDELKDKICSKMGMVRVKNIKSYQTSLELDTNRGGDVLDFDGQQGEFTEDEWREDLEERGFDPLSITKIIEELEMLEVIL